MKIVSYGAGTNSTAMLIGLYEHNERPDLILFADTGGERPETYRHLQVVNDWCRSVGFPLIVIVRETETLEENCLRRKALPGIAYGFKSCSEHYKTRPQKRWLKEQGIKDRQFLVGIDAGESHRAKNSDVRYPLIEWDWGREECIEAIERVGFQQPGKSSCFFCPSLKKPEIYKLKLDHPELLERALRIEANAELTSVKGLGRRFAWRDLINGSQIDISVTPEIPCMCFDGDI
jgi:Phosphoadenosine phosphosulfate reductase family